MGNISRRAFIGFGLGAAAAALVPRSLFAGEEAVAAGPAIAVARGDNDKLVKGALDLIGGISNYISEGDRVCIKPNLSFSSNVECGATTSAGVVKQVVEQCLEAGAARVIIVDHTIADAKLCSEKSGVEAAIVDPKKVSLVMLTQERQFAEVAVPNGVEQATVKAAKAAMSADKLISLPTAKSHSATGVSLGIKNLMGLVWDRGVMHRRDLNQAIAELAMVLKADLTIVDATRALTSGGPGGPGKTVALNTVVAGTDIVAVDSYTVGITQWYNKSFTGTGVKHIVAAHELGLGEIDTTRMDVRETQV